MENELNAVWEFVNSPLGLGLVAFCVAWVRGVVLSWRPTWGQYEGAIISAIKFAEKKVPAKSKEKSATRLKTALTYVVTLINEREHRIVKPKELAVIEDGIRVKHAELESSK